MLIVSGGMVGRVSVLCLSSRCGYVLPQPFIDQKRRGWFGILSSISEQSYQSSHTITTMRGSSKISHCCFVST